MNRFDEYDQFDKKKIRKQRKRKNIRSDNLFEKFDLESIEPRRENEKIKIDDSYDETVSVGMWIGLSICSTVLLNIPFGGIIMLVIITYMSFSKTINFNLRNYARAILIMFVCLIVFSIIFGYLETILKFIFN